jgi:hypothetical protein
MFNEIVGLLQQVTGGQVDPQAVSQAASDHVSSMDSSDLTQHLQTAADNANQNGQGGIAQQIMGLIQQSGTNPEALKQNAISLISNNPQILQQFAPDFAKGLLGRL